LGEVKNVTCVPFYQLIFFFITGLSRFVVWLSSKSVFYTHKMQIWLKWLEFGLVCKNLVQLQILLTTNTLAFATEQHIKQGYFRDLMNN
jgi:hypothetical protein